jgi:hypothetical protein
LLRRREEKSKKMKTEREKSFEREEEVATMERREIQEID